jgi:hypothetical protein
MSWNLMDNAPFDGTPVLGVDIVGDIVCCFWSEDEEQWLTFDDFAEPFGPVVWQPVEDIPDEDSELWSRAVDEFEQRCRAEEDRWGELAPTPRGPRGVDMDDL